MLSWLMSGSQPALSWQPDRPKVDTRINKKDDKIQEEDLRTLFIRIAFLVDDGIG